VAPSYIRGSNAPTPDSVSKAPIRAIDSGGAFFDDGRRKRLRWTTYSRLSATRRAEPFSGTTRACLRPSPARSPRADVDCHGTALRVRPHSKGKTP
jgi:hypothetical protein